MLSFYIFWHNSQKTVDSNCELSLGTVLYYLTSSFKKTTTIFKEISASIIKTQNKCKGTTTELIIHRGASFKIYQVRRHFYFLSNSQNMHTYNI